MRIQDNPQKSVENGKKWHDKQQITVKNGKKSLENQQITVENGKKSLKNGKKSLKNGKKSIKDRMKLLRNLRRSVKNKPKPVKKYLKDETPSRRSTRLEKVKNMDKEMVESFEMSRNDEIIIIDSDDEVKTELIDLIETGINSVIKIETKSEKQHFIEEPKTSKKIKKSKFNLTEVIIIRKQ